MVMLTRMTKCVRKTRNGDHSRNYIFNIKSSSKVVLKQSHR